MLVIRIGIEGSSSETYLEGSFLLCAPHVVGMRQQGLSWPLSVDLPYTYS